MQQAYAAHYSDIGDFKSGPVVLVEMKIQKISDGAPTYSIGNIAERTADYQANRSAAQLPVRAPEPHG